MALIPVTILTGFLGSGKTTLLNQLLKTKGREKVIIIMNEFGDTSIDHDLVLIDEDERIFQMNNGCMCCILREDLAEMFLGIMSIIEDSQIDIDRVIVETSGLAEPSPIAQTILRTPVLSESFMIDSILTLVDAKNATYQLDHYPEAAEQIAFADRLLLTKTDEVPKEELSELQKKLAKINPFIDKYPLQSTEIFNELIGLNLFDHDLDDNQIEADIDHMIDNHQHHDTHDHNEHHHHHVHTPVNSFVIQIDEKLAPDDVAFWIQRLIRLYGMDLMRYKGLLNIEGHKRPVVLQGVNMAFRLDEGESWKGEPTTKIVLIGQNLPEAEIRALIIGNRS